MNIFTWWLKLFASLLRGHSHLFDAWLGASTRTRGNSVPLLEQQLWQLVSSLIGFCFERCLGTSEDTYILKSYFKKVLSSCSHFKHKVGIDLFIQDAGRVRPQNRDGGWGGGWLPREPSGCWKEWNILSNTDSCQFEHLVL